MTAEKPKVSVSIVTYNHEKYISQALDSALMQEANFDYEILVGEDDSSDGTREIVKAYAERYPDRIRLFLNDRKNVIYIDGRPTGRWNLLNNFRNAQGDYIALLEGDDYWTSPHKLQRQIDVLENDKSLSMCFHPVNDTIGEEFERIRKPPMIKQSYTLDDLLVYNNFISTCSVVYRAVNNKFLPSWIEQTAFADWVLYMINLQFGQIGYINEVMGCYRIHSGAMWSSQSKSRQLERILETRKFVVEKLQIASRPSYLKGQSRLHFMLAEANLQEKEKQSARLNAIRGFLVFPLDRHFESIRSLLKVYLKSFLPTGLKQKPLHSRS
jgi:glycosyltransferase involved in cell wall biosynthesis